MVSVANNSAVAVNNVSVSANIPSEVSSLGNVQVNGVPVSGDIVSGIVVGSLSQGGAKTVTFEGKTTTFSTQGAKQATASVATGANPQSDTVSISLNPSQSSSAASVSSSSGSSGFWEFVKRLYLWILVALVLIFLFIVVFRRLSSNT